MTFPGTDPERSGKKRRYSDDSRLKVTDAPAPSAADYGYGQAGPRPSFQPFSQPDPRLGQARSRRSWGMLALLIALAVLVGIVIALVIPRLSPRVAESTGANIPTGQAANTLQSLTVVPKEKYASGYQRDLFGFRQTDDDGNGCDEREDVLARDLTEVRFRSRYSCKVQSGILKDPYTGQTIRFRRGVQTSAEVQIDHVVALHNAWNSGASAWSTAKRYKFANDPYNLLAVQGEANQEKGDAAADSWLPSNKAYRCSYVARQIGVKSKYGLTVTQAEKDSMMSVLSSCPAQKLP